MKIQLPIR